jgi:hypothetical protein
VFTNLANDKSVTGVLNVNQKDKRVIDNGDDTLTILILATPPLNEAGSHPEPASE